MSLTVGAYADLGSVAGGQERLKKKRVKLDWVFWGKPQQGVCVLAGDYRWFTAILNIFSNICLSYQSVQVTWPSSSPLRHSAVHTSACAGCRPLPGWHTGLEPGRADLAEENEETLVSFCSHTHSKCRLIPSENNLRVCLDSCVCVFWHHSHTISA